MVCSTMSEERLEGKPAVSPRRTTPLIAAVRKKDKTEVELLLATGSDPNENVLGDVQVVTPPCKTFVE